MTHPQILASSAARSNFLSAGVKSCLMIDISVLISGQFILSVLF